MIKKFLWVGGGILLVLGLFIAFQHFYWHCEMTTNGTRTLEYKICTDKKLYKYGENVRVRFTVTNLSAQSIHLDGGTESILDIWEHEWTWSTTQAQIVSQSTLAPKTSQTIEWLWIPTQTHLEDIFSLRQSRPFHTSFSGRVAGRGVLGISVFIKDIEYISIPVNRALSGHCESGRRPTGDLELQLCTDKRDYQFGDLIQIRWQIRNVSNAPIVLDGGDAAAMDIHIVERNFPTGKEYPIVIGEERWSDTSPFETQIELAPGEIYLVEWQWPTEQTDFKAILAPMRVYNGDEAAIYIYGDYFLAPGNRWSFTNDVYYAFENTETPAEK